MLYIYIETYICCFYSFIFYIMPDDMQIYILFINVLNDILFFIYAGIKIYTSDVLIIYDIYL